MKIIGQVFLQRFWSMRLGSISLSVSIAALLFVFAIAAPAQEPTVADVLDGAEKETAHVTPAEKTAAAAAPDAGVLSPPPEMRKTEKLGRETPRSSIARFLEAIDDNNYDTAAHYLDLRKLPRGMDAGQGPLYAHQLEVILERGLWFDVDDLSSEAEGFGDDGLPRYRDLVGTVDLYGESVDILLQHVPGDEGGRIWKFSNVTVANILRLHEVYGYGPYGEWLSARLPDYEFLGLQTWQWLVLFGLFAASYLVAYVGTWPVFYLLRRRRSGAGPSADLLAGPLRLLIMALLTKHWFHVLRPSIEARAIAEANTVLTIILMWFTFRLIDFIKEHYASTTELDGRDYAAMLLRPTATAVKILIAIVALVTWIENLGFKATTLIAGLGVGGLAVALAAQKSIENLIGAVTLYLSAPVKVGDLCRFGDQEGVIEEINLRATRIRTLDRSLIAVPNSIFSDMHLENISVREKIRYKPHLCLKHSTTAAQVREVLQGIRRELEQRADIDQENLYVRFEDFGERGLDFKALIYVLTQNYRDFLAVAEELNLRIMEIVADAGAELAEPLQMKDKQDR